MLKDALCHHGACHFHESGHVGAFHVVDVAVGFFAEELALVVYLGHDLLEFRIDFGGAP